MVISAQARNVGAMIIRSCVVTLTNGMSIEIFFQKAEGKNGFRPCLQVGNYRISLDLELLGEIIRRQPEIVLPKNSHPAEQLRIALVAHPRLHENFR
jgi:hypothetical protein